MRLAEDIGGWLVGGTTVEPGGTVGIDGLLVGIVCGVLVGATTVLVGATGVLVSGTEVGVDVAGRVGAGTVAETSRDQIAKSFAMYGP